MDLILAFLSAVFSSLTAIFGKKGLGGISSHVATFIRTGAVLLYVWGFAFFLGLHRQIADLSAQSILFLVLSGVSTGVSWLCYYQALSIGEVSRVTAVDKSGILLTVIIGMTFLGESVTAFKIAGLIVIAVGTYLMLGRPKAVQPVTHAAALEGESILAADAPTHENVPAHGTGSIKTAWKNHAWFFYASISAVFAALTSILAKVGLQEVDANLGTAIRTSIVFLFAGLMLFVTGDARKVRQVSRRDLFYLGLSALMTSLAWLCYFNALRLGEASVIAPIDKLSTVITIGLSVWILKEKATPRTFLGAALLTGGTVLMLF